MRRQRRNQTAVPRTRFPPFPSSRHLCLLLLAMNEPDSCMYIRPLDSGADDLAIVIAGMTKSLEGRELFGIAQLLKPKVRGETTTRSGWSELPLPSTFLGFATPLSLLCASLRSFAARRLSVEKQQHRSKAARGRGRGGDKRRAGDRGTETVSAPQSATNVNRAHLPHPPSPTSSSPPFTSTTTRRQPLHLAIHLPPLELTSSGVVTVG